MASYLMTMSQIHVLVVDYDSDIATLLETCQYKVTRVELASTGIRLLLSEKTKFDVVIADTNSVDGQSFNLLKEAVIRNIPTILMSVEDNPFVAMRTVENGALLHITKPASMELLKYLWQQVVREKARVISERDRVMSNNPNDVGAFNMQVESSRNIIRERKDVTREEEVSSDQQMMVLDKTKKKVSVQWTEELHEKFIDAVEQLGEGRCYPKSIHELMNVPGLTKMQVASHLQRCRDNKWPSIKGRRPQLGIQPVLSNPNLGNSMSRSYGTMPRTMPRTMSQLSMAPSYHVGIQEPNGAQIEMPNYGSIENMIIEPYETNTFHHNQWAPPAPYTGNATLGSSIPINLSDDLFNFPELGNTMENFFDLSHGLAWMSDLDPIFGDNHFDAAYHDQDSTLPNDGTTINRNSQILNFGRDESNQKPR